MGKLYIFRGIAATGKSTITDLISREFNITVLRKDDVYDMLSSELSDHNIKNKLSYNVLAKLIRSNLSLNGTLIIDIGLSNLQHLEEFLGKINLPEIEITKFLCICSDEQKWVKRIEERIKNPTPNQLFKTLNEALKYYHEKDNVAMKDETILDSSKAISALLEVVRKAF